MSNRTTTTFLPWLATEASRLAEATSTSGDPFPYLWGVALDALDWLRSAAPEDRAAALEAARRCLDSGAASDTAIPADPHAADCLVTLLRWVLDPPPVL